MEITLCDEKDVTIYYNDAGILHRIRDAIKVLLGKPVTKRTYVEITDDIDPW